MSLVQQIISLLTLAILVVVAMVWMLGTPSSPDTVPLGVVGATPAQFQEYIQHDTSRVLLDIRTSEEFSAGHLAGAENIDYYQSTFAQQLDQLDRDTPIAIYCRSGSRSGHTLEIMEAMGFTNVVELQGGVLAWQEDFNETICPGRVCQD